MDGDCAVVAVCQTLLAQQMPWFNQEEAREIGLESVSKIREAVAVELERNPVLKEAWASGSHRERFIGSLNKHASPDHELPMDATDQQVLTAIRVPGKDGGPWFGGLLLSAMAIVVKKDIAVIADGTVTVYTKHPGRLMFLQEWPFGQWRSTAEGVYFGEMRLVGLSIGGFIMYA